MSAIGNYIHLTTKGYQEHGTTRDGSFDSWDSQRNWIKSRLNLKKVPKDMSELEDAIAAIKTEPKYKDTRDAIAQEVLEKFGDQIANINFENQTIVSANTGGPKMKMVHASRQADNTLGFDIKTITKQVEQLEIIIKEICEKQPLSDNEVKNLRKKIAEVKKMYKTIYGGTYKQIKALGWMPKTTEKADFKNINSLRNAMNEIINEYAHYPAISLQEGALFENTISALNYVLNGTVVENVNSVIKENLKGDKNVQVDFDLDNFSSDFSIRETVGQNVALSLDGSLSRRSKIDVTLQWGEEEYGVSAKNIAIKNNKYHWVTVVSGSPLLVMVAGLDANFVNHYLNVYNAHNSDKHKINIEDSELGNEMKLLLFYEGLTGDNGGRQIDTASIFAVNDKVSKRVKFIPMKAILDDLETHVKDISVKINGTNLLKYRFTNKWEQDYTDRIAKIINQMHQAKVHASFNIMSTPFFK